MSVLNNIVRGAGLSEWQEMRKELCWMLRHMKNYWLWITFYIVAGIVGIGFSMGASVASKYLIDEVLDGSAEVIAEYAALMAGMALGNICVTAGVSRISARIMVDVQNEMRGNLFREILYSRWEELQLYSTGDLLNRLNSDMGTVSRNIISWMPSLVTKGCQFVGSFALILYYDATMAVLALVSAPVTLMISRLLMRKLRYYNKEMCQISSDMMSFQNDSFHNLQTLKAFGLMNVFHDKMENMQGKYRERLLDYNKFNIFVSSYMSVTGLIVSYLCFGWSIYRLWGGYISMGTMAMFLQLSTRLAASFSGLVYLVPSLLRAMTSAGRIMAVEGMGKEPASGGGKEENQNEGKDIEVELVLKDVSVAYEDGEAVFSHSDFRVKSGEVVALVGPSGEGKTTMIRLLLGLLEPQEGCASLVWENGTHQDISAATRNCFSYVPQGNTIFMGTIADNLRLVAPEAREEELWAALDEAGAGEFVRKFPDGLQHYVGEKGAGISEGQAQRIAIARAVLRDAPVLLLDEATSALDVENAHKILRRILKGNRSKMCILTTHRPDLFYLCDRVYEVRDGKLCEKKTEEKGKQL